MYDTSGMSKGFTHIAHEIGRKIWFCVRSARVSISTTATVEPKKFTEFQPCSPVDGAGRGHIVLYGQGHIVLNATLYFLVFVLMIQETLVGERGEGRASTDR